MLKSVLLAAATLFALFAGQRRAAADTAVLTVNGGTVSILGSIGSESFYVNERLVRGYIDSRGTYHPARLYLLFRVYDRTGKLVIYRSFPKSDVSLIAIDANDGDDYIVINTDVNSCLLGGEGSDEIHGGDGDDHIDAGTGGLDFIYGHGGNDTLVGGRKWSLPGTMPEMTEMDGGAGSDTFIYNQADRLHTDDFSAEGWMVVPDYTYDSGPYAGMHVLLGS